MKTMTTEDRAGLALILVEEIGNYGAASSERMMQLWGGVYGRQNVLNILEGLGMAGILLFTGAQLWIVA